MSNQTLIQRNVQSALNFLLIYLRYVYQAFNFPSDWLQNSTNFMLNAATLLLPAEARINIEGCVMKDGQGKT